MAEKRGGLGAVFVWFRGALIEHWIGILVGAGTLLVTTLAAVSKFLRPYGALGWAAAAIVTLLLLSLIYAVYAWAMDRVATSNYKHMLTGLTPTVNPMATNFEDQRISIAEFFHPLSVVHQGKTFRRCEFIGPGAIAFLSHTNVFEPNMIACDLVAVKTAPIHTAAGFERSQFDRCRFINLTVFLPEHLVKGILTEMKSDQPIQIIGYNA